MSRTLGTTDLLDLMETLLQAQLDTIQEIRRVYLAEDGVSFLHKATGRRALSQVDMAREVLVAAGGPLHIGEIAKRVREAYGVFATRETLAAAATRAVKTGKHLVKVGPNTYGIPGRDQS